MSALIIIKLILSIVYAAPSPEIVELQKCVADLSQAKSQALSNRFVKVLSNFDESLATIFSEVDVHIESMRGIQASEATLKDENFAYLASNSNEACIEYSGKVKSYLAKMFQFWTVLGITCLALTGYYFYVVLILLRRAPSRVPQDK